MQYIHSQQLANALANTLKQATYQPTTQRVGVQSVYLKNPVCVANHSNNTIKSSFWKKNKYVIATCGMLALFLPTKSLTSVQTLSSMEKIGISDTLTVAVADDDIFVNDKHMHGFGYDVASRYADHIGATLQIRSYSNQHDAFNAIKSGEADILIGSDYLPNQEGVVNTTVSCNRGLSNAGLDNNTHLIINKNNTALIDSTTSYLCDPEVSSDTKTMAKFYKTDALDAYSVMHFDRAIKERLPLYEYTFKTQAKKYNHDWQVLAAISYQESHLEPTATSRTGVQGLMMLTNDTAAMMGVTDRTDAVQSIQGGAKYLSKLNAQFDDIAESDRLWFVLAAYNMGPNAVRNIQAKIAEAGDNPNLWSNFYTYLHNNAKDNGRYVQCMHYVTNIRTYIETLKSDEVAKDTPSTDTQKSAKMGFKFST